MSACRGQQDRGGYRRIVRAIGRGMAIGVVTWIGLISLGCSGGDRDAAATVRGLQQAWLDDDPGHLYDLLSTATRDRLDAHIAIAIMGLRPTDDVETTDTFGASKADLEAMKPRERFIAFAGSRHTSDRQPWTVRVHPEAESPESTGSSPSTGPAEPTESADPTVAAIPQVVGEVPSTTPDKITVTLRAPDGTEHDLRLVREEGVGMVIDGTGYCQLRLATPSSALGLLALIGVAAGLGILRRFTGAGGASL